ncbi:hypothetical protein WT57_25140 [Burkholderia pseudomultivorans]|uniref:Uncharacterized protein n=1 Tax=Burkholderia pseudomultivorans TaxID=1207504 RepID=A0A132EXP4_9BURK|nr:hypothetical protein WT57_25140 [Burkholderia pseudomultivorans]
MTANATYAEPRETQARRRSCGAAARRMAHAGSSLRAWLLIASGFRLKAGMAARRADVRREATKRRSVEAARCGWATRAGGAMHRRATASDASERHFRRARRTMRETPRPCSLRARGRRADGY